MGWLLPASICILVSMLTLATVFGYLHWTYKERYLKYWMASCASSSVRYLALIGQLTLGKSLALVIVYNVTTVLAAFLVLVGAQIFGRGKFPRWPYLFLVAGILWGIWGPLAGYSAPTISIPIFFLLGTAYILVGALFLKYSVKPRPASVTVTSLLFILWGLHQYDYPVLRFVEWFAPIGYGIGGTFALATSIGIILTYFERTRQEILEREENFRILFECAADSILLLEIEGDKIPVIRDVNASTISLYGYTREELIGKEISILDPDPDIERNSRERHADILHHQKADFTVTHRTKDGRERLLSAAATCVNRGGKTMILSSERDITDLKRAEEEKQRLNSQLAQAQKMESVGRLAGGVAHDFNNMLSVIMGHSELALATLSPTDPLHEDLSEINEAARRSADLTRQLLAFARKQSMTPRILDLNSTIEESLRMLKRLIREEVSIKWAPGENLPPVMMDPAQVDQIMTNLVLNARDALVGNGAINIETKVVAFDHDDDYESPDFLPGVFNVIEVSDNGVGMDKEALEKIFEPFFTTKELGRGTGMGLATVHGIVKQNSGFIVVRSEPGEGSSFWVHLPAHRVTQPVPSNCVEETLLKGNGELILLVEDEPSLMKLTMKMVKELGYDVLGASTTEEAIRLARENASSISLVLTDVVMPEMNGKELSNLLSAENPRLKFLFMSGYPEHVITRRGIVMDDGDFMEKPITSTLLGRKIQWKLKG